MSYLFPSPTITFEAALRDLGSKSAKARAAAAHALGDATEAGERRRAVDGLLAALEDQVPQVRAEAAASLGTLESPAAAPALAARLRDSEPLVRQSAAIALGKLGVAAAFEPLRAALADGPPDLRFQAATSLVEVDPDRAVEPLLAALSDPDGDVVGAAALALGAVGASEAADALARAMGDWSRPTTRFDLAYALADLGDRRGLDVLIGFVDDRAAGWDALEALERLHAAEAADAVAPMLSRRLLMPELRLRAAATLLSVAPDHAAAGAARQALLEGLGMRKLRHRGLAVELLGRVGGAWARSALLALRGSRKGRPLQEEITQTLDYLQPGSGSTT